MLTLSQPKVVKVAATLVSNAFWSARDRFLTVFPLAFSAGEVATSVLIPKVVDYCKGKKSPLTGKDIIVVAAGGIADGRGLAMSLALGASGELETTLTTVLVSSHQLTISSSLQVCGWELAS